MKHCVASLRQLSFLLFKLFLRHCVSLPLALSPRLLADSLMNKDYQSISRQKYFIFKFHGSGA